MTTRLIPFVSGTDKQVCWAINLRREFVVLLLENEFKVEEILLLIDIRPIAVWWIENRAKLNLANARKLISAAKAARTVHGSIEKAVQAQSESIDRKIMKAMQLRMETEREEAIENEQEYLEDLFEGRARSW